MEDVVGLLLQYGRICASEASKRPLSIQEDQRLTNLGSPTHTADLSNGFTDEQPLCLMAKMQDDESLPKQVQETFKAILQESVLEKRLY